jgi:hypothetical protein
MKIAIALAVALFGTALLSGTAEARCWWDGYKTVCVHHDYYGHDHLNRDYHHRHGYFNRDYYHRDNHFNRDHQGETYYHDSLGHWR